MPNKEITIAGGPNNTKAMVTGQQELLVKVSNQTLGTPISANLTRRTDSGTIDKVLSASFANVGTVDIYVLGTIVKPSETISFDAGIGNYYETIAFDTAGGEVLIAYNTIV